MLHLGRLPHRSHSLDSAAPPDAFGPFRVLHQIGAGTLGPVFRAYDAERERLVAVKLFKLDLPPERVHQLVAALEELIAADLTHPALAVPLATGMTGVSAYLAQDYVAAESLDLAVREYGPAPPADALRVAAQLAGALDFGAVVNTHHVALHPRDILLSADETRLTGIGITRALERIGVAPPVRRPYAAPERMAGAAWDRRADVFGLAALVHELLWARRIAGSGSRAADGLTELAGAQLSALKDTFARALADDPRDRFDTALEFAEALKGAFPEVALSAPAPPKRRTAIAGQAEAPADLLEEPQLSLDVEPDAAREDLNLPELDLRAAEQERYRDVESAPSVAVPLLANTPAIATSPADDRSAERIAPSPSDRVEASSMLDAIPPPISVIEQSRSAVWPLMAALALGLAIGFAGGYGVGTREHLAAGAAATSAPESATAADPPVVPVSAPVSPTGRESTEVAVPEAPKPAPSPAPPPAAAPAVRAPRRAEPAPRPLPPRRPPPPARTAQRATATPPAGTAGRYVGSLSVESKPQGARVFLDGRLIGTTPLAVPSVPAGSHAVRIERDGYRRWSSSVRVVAAEQNRVTASLER
jgi:serine/threonine protein kinase